MIFGGDKVPEDYQSLPDSSNYTMQVTGMQDANALLFTLFRLTLVDEYDYDVSSVKWMCFKKQWLEISA